MNVTRLRAMMRKHGALAVPVVGGYLLLRFLWQRKALSLALIATLGILTFGLRGRHTELTPLQTLDGPTPEAYTITDLGTMGGEVAQPLGINGQGQIVGAALTSDKKVRAFFWQQGKMRDIGT